jgi:succinate dehydrogenase / fumarate reductase, iron-sulfur subunit
MAGADARPGGAAASLRATLEVRRYDPDIDGAAAGGAAPSGSAPLPNAAASAAGGRWQRYDVELPAGSTMLEALMYVQDHVDGSLAFRRSCRHGICGSCGMRVNGCARLACTTQLSLAIEEAKRRAARASTDPVVRVEPLGNMPLIKDLVTDMTVFWEKLSGVQPWLQALGARSGDDRERLMAPHEQAVLAEGVLCVECGACYSDCVAVEASPEFVGPTALVKAYRYAYDVRDDQAHHRLYDLNGEHGLWECTRCYTCTQRCPKHLRVRELIGRLAELAQVEGLRTDAAVKRAHAFVRGIEHTGRLDERTLGLDTLGAKYALAAAPAAARAVAAGKVRPGGREPVGDLDLVRRLCGRLNGMATGGTAASPAEPGPGVSPAPTDDTTREERS